MQKSKKELLEENDDIVRSLQKLEEARASEGRLFSEQELNDAENKQARLGEIKSELATIQRSEHIKALAVNDSANIECHQPHNAGWTKKKESLAFKAWVHTQSGNSDLVRGEMKQAAHDLGVNLNSQEYILRDQSLTVGEGGYTTGGAVYSGLEKTIKYYGGIASVCDYQTVPRGQAGSWSTIDDTANEAAAVNEKAGAANTAITVGTIPYVFCKIGSGVFPISNELLEDSLENWDQIVNEVLGERIGRKVNTHTTLGNLTSSKGFMLETVEGKAAADDVTLTWDELVDLFHSVDPAYRDSPSCRWMMNDKTFAYLRKMVNTHGDPIFMDNVMAGNSPAILGKPILICNKMADIAAESKPIAFGDCSKFKVRVVGTPSVFKFNELYQDNDCVGFVSHLRLTSRLVQPSAIKHIAMHS